MALPGRGRGRGCPHHTGSLVYSPNALTNSPTATKSKIPSKQNVSKGSKQPIGATALEFNSSTDIFECACCDQSERDANLLFCPSCARYYHPFCENLYSDALIFYSKNYGIPYHCTDCRPILASRYMSHFVAQIGEQLTTFNDKIVNLSQEVSSLKQQIILKDRAEFESALEDHLAKHTAELKADLQDKHMRRKRVIIFGLSDSSNDDVSVSELAAELSISCSVVKTFRLKTRTRSQGQSSISIPPLIAEFQFESDKFKFLSKEI